MTKYDITIEGYESGLTRATVESTFQDQFPDQDVVVVESESAED